jgi:Protein of unknown function (DUF551)
MSPSARAKALTLIGWQPIETVQRKPLDKFGYGPPVLLWVDGQWGIGFWDDDFGNLYVAYPEQHRDRELSPSHWMPLPEPPEVE